MLRIRELEERVSRRSRSTPALNPRPQHLADGAEASIAGSLAAMRFDDQEVVQ